MEMDGTKQNELKEQISGGIRVLDALSASGLRAIRFAKEVSGVDLVVANDFSEHAFKTIQRNVQLNGLEGRVRPMHSDAMFG
jgi:tRNA (guanine26-N2/guanine27-N2)-dimethyltransferase